MSGVKTLKLYSFENKTVFLFKRFLFFVTGHQQVNVEPDNEVFLGVYFYFMLRKLLLVSYCVVMLALYCFVSFESFVLRHLVITTSATPRNWLSM